MIEEAGVFSAACSAGLVGEFSWVGEGSGSMGKRFEPVLLVDKDDLRVPLFGFFLVHRYECCDDDLVPRLYLSGSCSVERDYSGSRVGWECVGGEPLAG